MLGLPQICIHDAAWGTLRPCPLQTNYSLSLGIQFPECCRRQTSTAVSLPEMEAARPCTLPCSAASKRLSARRRSGCLPLCHRPSMIVAYSAASGLPRVSITSSRTCRQAICLSPVYHCTAIYVGNESSRLCSRPSTTAACTSLQSHAHLFFSLKSVAQAKCCHLIASSARQARCTLCRFQQC